MPLWGRNDQAVTANSTTTKESSNGAPIGLWRYVKGGRTGSANTAHTANAYFGNTSAGSRANVDSNMFGNVTPGAFTYGQAVGVFGVSPTEMSNNTINHVADQPGHAGWVIRRAGCGPIISYSVSAAGQQFSNGESILVSNGSAVATLRVVTTTGTNTFANDSFSAGNIASISIGPNDGGLFTNTAILGTPAFQRELHVIKIQAVNAAAAVTGYANTDFIRISGNSTVLAIRIAQANISTNTTGGFTNNNITINDPGLFTNTFANTQLTVQIVAANGFVNGTGTGITSWIANLATSTTGTLGTAVLGGRAGRVHTETIVAMGSLGAQTAASGTPALVADASDNTYYPGT